MITATLWTLAGLLVLAIAVLSLPVRLRLHANAAPHRRFRVDMTTLAGVPAAIPLFDSDRRGGHGRGKRKKRKTRRRSMPGGRRSTGGLRLARAVPRLLGDLLGQLRVDRIDAVCEFGFDDPCDTGVVFGLLSPLAHIVPSVSPAHVELRPVFEGACLSGDIDATVRVTPVRLIPPAVRFAWRALGPGRA